MNLTEVPEIVQWPPTRYVFIEKIGPFMQTARQAWQELHQLEPPISAHNQIIGAMALYKMKPDTYRAGFILDATPVSLPSGLHYEHIPGGEYSKFVLTGSYSNLPQASGRVWEIVSKTNMMLRPDFAIEHYSKDPKTTPEAELITEILIPTA
jgi:DNA gyrase inhibitor GyrI